MITIKFGSNKAHCNICTDLITKEEIAVEFKGFKYCFETHFYCIHNKVKEFQNEI
jgi:hypothetical protein